MNFFTVDFYQLRLSLDVNPAVTFYNLASLSGSSRLFVCVCVFTHIYFHGHVNHLFSCQDLLAVPVNRVTGERMLELFPFV